MEWRCRTCAALSLNITVFNLSLFVPRCSSRYSKLFLESWKTDATISNKLDDSMKASTLFLNVYPYKNPFATTNDREPMVSRI